MLLNFLLFFGSLLSVASQIISNEGKLYADFDEFLVREQENISNSKISLHFINKNYLYNCSRNFSIGNYLAIIADNTKTNIKLQEDCWIDVRTGAKLLLQNFTLEISNRKKSLFYSDSLSVLIIINTVFLLNITMMQEDLLIIGRNSSFLGLNMSFSGSFISNNLSSLIEIKRSSKLFLFNTQCNDLFSSMSYFLSSKEGCSLYINKIVVNSGNFIGNSSGLLFLNSSEIIINQITFLNNTINSANYSIFDLRNSSIRILSFFCVMFQQIKSSSSRIINGYSNSRFILANSWIKGGNSFDKLCKLQEGRMGFFLNNLFFGIKNTQILFIEKIERVSVIACSFFQLINSTAIVFKDIFGNISVNQVKIANSLSFLNTIGIILSDSKENINENHFFLITSSIFLNISVIYTGESEIGAAIFLGNNANLQIYIHNSLFILNSLQAYYEKSMRNGGSCLNVLSNENGLLLISSIFFNNSAEHYSNVIYFLGRSLNLLKSRFINNSPLVSEKDWEILYTMSNVFFAIVEVLSKTAGGVVFCKSNLFVISSCDFVNNSAFNGGVVYLDGDPYFEKTDSFCVNSSFKGNRASWGGALFYAKGLVNFKGVVKNSYFSLNSAKQSGSIMTAYQTPTSILIVRESLFFDNHAEQGGVTIGIHLTSCSIFINNVFIENKAFKIPGKISAYVGGVYGTAGDMTTRFYFFNNNYFANEASIAAGSGGFFSGIGSFIKENHYFSKATVKGGIAVVEEGAKAYYILSNFTKLYSGFRAGAFEVNEVSSLYLKEINIFDSYSEAIGGMFFILNSGNFTAEACVFMRGESQSGAFMSAIQNEASIISIYNCTILDFKGENYAFDLINSNIVLNYSIISNFSTGMLFSQQSDVDLNNIVIDSFNLISGLTLIESIFLSKINIERVIIGKIIGYNNKPSSIIFAGYESEILLSFISITNASKEGLYGSLLWVNNCTVVLQNSSILNFSFSNGIYLYQSSFKIYSSLFDNQKIQIKQLQKQETILNGIILTLDSNITIQNTKFIGGCSLQGGSIQIKGRDDMTSNELVQIQNTVFYKNYALEGGSIWIYNHKVSLISCEFIENEADTGAGVFFDLEKENSPLEQNLLIISCNFINNTALKGGGGVQWNHREPLINKSSCVFQGNKALYGNNIATKASRLFIQVYDKKNNTIIYDSQNNHSFFELMAVSGQHLEQNIVFIFVDCYNQTVKTIDATLRTIFIMTLEQYNNIFLEQIPSQTSNFQPFLLGQAAMLKQGTLNYSQITIYASPNSTVFLVLNPFDYSKYLTTPDSSLEKDLNGQYFFTLKVRIRECIPGEILSVLTQACLPCGPGLYSFNPLDGSCKDCPLTAECAGGAHISLMPGYWRASNTSAWIHSCDLSKENCIGGEESLCKTDFYGPLCFSCKPGTTRVSFSLCSDCMGQSLSILRICLVLLMLLAVLFMLIRSSIDNMKIIVTLMANKEEMNENDVWQFMDFQNIYMKILLNNFQMTSVLSEVELIWPDFLLQFFEFLAYFSNMSAKLMAFECVFTETTTEIPAVYTKLILINCVPCVLIILVALFWLIFSMIRPTKAVKEKIFTTVIGIFVMMQPTIIAECSSIMNCMEIEPNLNVLKQNPINSCDSGLHINFLYYLAVPSFFSWGILIPLLILFYLFKRRHQLYEGNVFGKFNFFYIGYKARFFYWDFVIMARKILLILLLNFTDLKVDSKLYLCLFLFSFCLYYQMKFKPFSLKIFNRLEMWSYLCGLGDTFIAFLISMLEDSNVKSILFFMILFLNTGFLAIWTLYYSIYSIKASAKFIKKRFPKLYNKMREYLYRTSQKFTPFFGKASFARNLGSNTGDNSEKKIASTKNFEKKIRFCLPDRALS